jgi:hypothetical protein
MQPLLRYRTMPVRNRSIAVRSILTALITVLGFCYVLLPVGGAAQSHRVRALTKENNTPPWKQASAEVDLDNKRCLPYSRIDFSASGGDMILVRYRCPADDTMQSHMDMEHFKGDESLTALSLNGKIINAKDNAGKLKTDYRLVFPEAYQAGKVGDLIQDAFFWAVSPDGHWLIRSTRCISEPSENYPFGICRLELFDFEKRILIWEKKIESCGIKNADFIKRNGKNLVLCACSTKADILNIDTGEVVRTIKYTGPDNDTEKISPGFWAWQIAYNPVSRLLACGDFDSRRVRIYSTEPPFPLIRELNALDTPNRPMGGVWRVAGIEFNRDGSYLIVRYEFTGRWTSKRFFPTEVLSTGTWSVCWSENSEDLTHVSLSATGGHIAYVEHGVLKIGMFENGCR